MNTPPSHSRDQQRLTKLLALAADREGTPEGEQAAAKARELLRRLAKERQVTAVTDPLDPFVRGVLHLGLSAPWRRRLAAAVARHAGCASGAEPASDRVILFGRRSALAIADYLYAIFAREIGIARSEWRQANPEANPTEVNSFCHSAVTAVEHRLRDLRRGESQVDPVGTALVRADGRDLEAWMEAQGVRIVRGAPSPYGFNGEGYAAGHGISVHEGVRAEPASGQIDRSS